jgi:O-antigen ligase
MSLSNQSYPLNVAGTKITSRELGASAYTDNRPARGLLVRISRTLLFIAIFVIYTAALPFFITVSPDLLYGTYVVIGICGVVIISFERRAHRNLLSVAPYLIWLLIFYCFWGSIVSTSADLPEDEVMKLFTKNLVVLGGFALAVHDRRDLARAARWVIIGALFGLAICFWELWDPNVILTLSLGRDPESNAFNLLRPAALWRNPDEAAFAFVFGFLISRWAGRRLAWIGRLGCLIGIYLTASRTGVYVLALCGLIYLALKLRLRGFFFRCLKTFSLGLAATAAVVVVLTSSTSLRSIDLSDQWQISRIVDFAEKRDRDSTAPTRLEIAQRAIELISARPWLGTGVFSFDPDLGNTGSDIGVHNVFILVWGETGIPGVVAFLLVLALGIQRSLHPQIQESERHTMLLMWISYFVIGLTWHNQFTAFTGMFYAALLYHLPSVLRRRHDLEPVVETRKPVPC